MNTARCFLVLPAALAGLLVGFVGALVLHRVAMSLCPPTMLVSGMCMAPWHRSVVTVAISLAAASGAFCAVAFPAATVPSQKREVALAALAIGGALAFVLLGPLSLPFLSAVCGGVAGLAVIYRRTQVLPNQSLQRTAYGVR